MMTVDPTAVMVITPLLGLLRDLSGGFTAPWAFLLALVMLVPIRRGRARDSRSRR